MGQYIKILPNFTAKSSLLIPGGRFSGSIIDFCGGCDACGAERPGKKHCREWIDSFWGGYCYHWWEDCGGSGSGSGCAGGWKCDDGRCCEECRAETPGARCCRQVGSFVQCKGPGLT
jgi:hypothetical protein